MTAALYARISKDPLEEGAGVDRQEADCRKMLARQGFTDPLVFRDNDRSAWSRHRKRPAWDDLLHQVRAGTITTLAVWHPDRLMRQPRDLEDLLDAADRGLQLLSAGGGRDLSNPDDRFVLRIEVAAACKASDDASRRIRRVFDDRAAAGLPHGGRAFGDQPGEADAVRDAATLLLAGGSLRSICTAWNDAGIPTVRGAKRWSEHVVRGVLIRPSIAGYRVHRGQIVGRASTPPVLDEGTWRALVDLFSDPGRRDQRTTAYRHLLSGLLYCSPCDARMRSLKQSSSPTRRRYACPVCFRNAISEQQLDAYMEGAVAGRLDRTTLPDLTGPTDDTEAELDAARRRLGMITREFTTDPDVSPAQFRVMTRRLNATIRLLEAKQTARAVAAAAPRPGDDWQQADLDGRRRVVWSQVDRIDVVPAGKAGRYIDPGRLTISWR